MRAIKTIVCVHGVIECDDGEEREGAMFVAGRERICSAARMRPEWRGDRDGIYGASTKVSVTGRGEKVCGCSLDDQGSEACWLALNIWLIQCGLFRQVGTYINLVERACYKIGCFLVRY